MSTSNKKQEYNEKIAKTTNTQEAWNNFRRARNRVNNKLRYEKTASERNSIHQVENDLTGKQMWELVKRKAGWVKNLSPF